MINREILEQIGFVLGSGWDHEVWVYDGDFWVHYDGEFRGLEGSQISGSSSMEDFFKMFLSSIEAEVMDRATVHF